jgi:hypothetical protein
MEIGGVLALVILAMVDLNFVRTAPWEAMFCIIWPMLFLYQVKYPTVPSLRSLCIFLQQQHFGCGPLYCEHQLLASILSFFGEKKTSSFLSRCRRQNIERVKIAP